MSFLTSLLGGMDGGATSNMAAGGTAGMENMGGASTSSAGRGISFGGSFGGGQSSGGGSSWGDIANAYKNPPRKSGKTGAAKSQLFSQNTGFGYNTPAGKQKSVMELIEDYRTYSQQRKDALAAARAPIVGSARYPMSNYPYDYSQSDPYSPYKQENDYWSNYANPYGMMPDYSQYEEPPTWLKVANSFDYRG